MRNKQNPLSPLADPVVAAVFDSVENAGEAAASLAGSILAEDGIKIGKVIEVTPQRYYKEAPDMRGCRVDIYVESEDKQRTIIEVQMSDEPIMARNLFEYAQLAVSTVAEGVKTPELHKAMPKLIIINICNFSLRKTGNDDFLQPVKQMYTKDPEVAQNYISIYNVQLPNFRKLKHDLSKPLDAWIFILDTAEQEGRMIDEVIEMHPELQNAIKKDSGISQFVSRYDTVTRSGDLRSEADRWLAERMRISGMMYAAEQNALLKTARNMLLGGLSREQISAFTGLPISDIENL